MPDLNPYESRLNQLSEAYGPLKVRVFNASEAEVDTFMWTLGVGEGGPPLTATTFRSPVGTDEEIEKWLRTVKQQKRWPGAWWQATGYAEKYTALGPEQIHTGADLNESVTGNPYADSGKPVRACARGRVLFAGVRPAWGVLVVIEHYINPLTRLWSRYGHLGSTLLVRPGDQVTMLQPIGTIGDYGQAGPKQDHLHLDFCVNDIIVNNPAHWPGNNLAMVKSHYVDPLNYILAHL